MPKVRKVVGTACFVIINSDVEQVLDLQSLLWLLL